LLLLLLLAVGSVLDCLVPVGLCGCVRFGCWRWLLAVGCWLVAVWLFGCVAVLGCFGLSGLLAWAGAREGGESPVAQSPSRQRNRQFAQTPKTPTRARAPNAKTSNRPKRQTPNPRPPTANRKTQPAKRAPTATANPPTANRQSQTPNAKANRPNRPTQTQTPIANRQTPNSQSAKPPIGGRVGNAY